MKLDTRDVAPDPPKDIDEAPALEKVPRVLEAQDLHEHVHVLSKAHLWLDDAEIPQNVGQEPRLSTTWKTIGIETARASGLSAGWGAAIEKKP